MNDYTDDEFYNVLTGDAGRRLVPLAASGLSFPPRDAGAWQRLAMHANANGSALQRVIDAAHAHGGYVYFPPGRYLIGRSGTATPAGAVDVADVLVYDNVTLRFAPGAVLVPMNFDQAREGNRRPMPGRPDEDYLVRIEIQGDLDAGVEQIFDTVLDPAQFNAPFGGTLRAGLVLFTSERIREVRPEWWGVTTLEQLNGQAHGARNARALQAAIDAGHTHRRRPLRTPGKMGSPRENALVELNGEVQWWSRSSIPVVVQNQYVIGWGLRVGTMESTTTGVDARLLAANPACFAMVGEREAGHAGAGRLSLIASFPYGRPGPARDPMLVLRGTSSFSIREVNLSGGGSADDLVHVEAGNDHGSAEFRRCAFLNTRGGEGAVMLRVVSPMGHDAMTSISFTGCRVRTNPTPTTRPGVVPAAFNLLVRGVLLDLDDNTMVEFRNCFLDGVAAPMIHALRGRFSLNECTFHIGRRLRDPPYDGFDGLGPFRNSPNGTDIFIEAPSSGPPASFTAREVESQSFQFLASFPGSTPPVGMARRSACVLLNVHHSVVPGGGADPDSLPLRHTDWRPSMFWSGPGRLGAHLIAIGCRFTAEYGVPAAPGTSREATVEELRMGSVPRGAWSGTLGGIRVAENMTGLIYHLGNCTFRSAERYDTDSVEVRPELVILSDNRDVRLTNLRVLPVLSY